MDRLRAQIVSQNESGPRGIHCVKARRCDGCIRGYCRHSIGDWPLTGSGLLVVSEHDDWVYPEPSFMVWGQGKNYMRIYLYRLGGLRFCDPLYLCLLLLFSSVFLLWSGIGFRVFRVSVLGYSGQRGRVSNHAQGISGVLGFGGVIRVITYQVLGNMRVQDN